MRSNARNLRIALLGASALAIAGPAFAQAQPGSAVEEVIVTALKRATNIQQTPIAISAVTADTIANSGVQSIADLGASVPSLNFVDGGPSFRRVVIRGIYAAGEPTVGTYYDETPVTGSIGAGNNAGGSTPELRLFDVDRVEVLRGPQGTLYGSGSMGGTLRVIYKKPSYKFESAADVSLSDTSGAEGLNYEANGLVNVPLADDKVALRLVGFYRKKAGYIDNTFLKQDGVNSAKDYGGRALLRLDVTEKLTIDIAAYLNRSRADSNSFIREVGTFKTDSRILTPADDNLNLYSITGNYDMGPVAATGSVSYLRRTLSSVSDVSRYIQSNRSAARCAALTNGGLPCSPQQVTDFFALVDGQSTSGLYPQQEMDTYTAELRFSSKYESPLQWTVGGFYSDRQTTVYNPQVNFNPTTGKVITPNQVATARRIDDELQQYAAFGELSYDVTDKLNFTAGARYFKYTKDIVGQTYLGSPLVGARITPPTAIASDEKGWVLRFNGSYKITSDFMVYAEASQGFRPGGANQVLGLDAALTPYDSDKLWNYEAGFKSSWLDRRMTFNADVFQIDWSDMQITTRTPNGAFSYIGNAGKARIRGVEAEAALHPIQGLTLTGNLAAMKAELTENQPNAGTAIAPAAGFDGDRIPYVPKFTAGLAAQYEWAINENFNGFARVDANHVGGSYSDFRPSYTYTRYIKPYDLMNLRVGVEAKSDKWGVYLFATNVFNKLAVVNATSSAIGQNLTSAVAAPPRTIGVNLRSNF
jgi:iron complex outermembrane receptor protein